MGGSRECTFKLQSVNVNNKFSGGETTGMWTRKKRKEKKEGILDLDTRE